MAEYFTMEGQDERNILNLLFVTFLAMKKKLISLSLIRRIYELKILQFAGFGLQSLSMFSLRVKEYKRFSGIEDTYCST